MFLGQWGLCEGAEVRFLAYICLKCLSRPDIKPYKPKNLKSVKFRHYKVLSHFQMLEIHSVQGSGDIQRV